MINVLYVHNSALISGGERSLLQLWAQLDRSTFKPVLVLPGEGPLAVEARGLGVEVHFFKVASIRPWSLVSLFKAVKFIRRLIRLKKITVVHTYAPRNNLVSWVAARSAGARIIWHERNLLWHPAGAKREVDVTRLCMGLPDGVICNSAALAARFMVQGSLPKKVRIIHNGVDLTHFVPATDKAAARKALGCEGKKVVGLITNLQHRKGVDTFLEIAFRTARGRSDVFFIIVGGSYHASDAQVCALHEKAKALGLEKLILWSGFQDDVRPYLAAFDVSCNVTEKEACSRAILESMAMGVPVAAFCDGGNPELVKDGGTGVLVPLGALDVFASRLIGLMDDENGRVRMGQEARRHVEAMFDIRKNTQATQIFYKDVLGLSGEKSL